MFFNNFFHYLIAPSKNTPKRKTPNPETNTVAITPIIIWDFYLSTNSPLIF